MIPRLKNLIRRGRQFQGQQNDEYRLLIRREAEIGGKLFGPVEPSRIREFFCMDEHTWVWHEEWTDQRGKHHVVTTRYDVRPYGILKAQNGQPYRFVAAQEADHLIKAIRLYYQQVVTGVYDINPSTITA